MFSNTTKVLAVIFGLCCTSTIASAIDDHRLDKYTDSESAYLRSEEAKDQNFKNMIHIKMLNGRIED